MARSDHLNTPSSPHQNSRPRTNIHDPPSSSLPKRAFPKQRSHHIIVGGSVLGGKLYGQYPLLALSGPDDANSRGTLIPTTSVAQYAATLATWFGVDSASLPTVCPNIRQLLEQPEPRLPQLVARQCDDEQVRIAPLTLLILATACRQSPKPADLAAYLPTSASIVIGVNVDALRNTTVFPKLPENFREASYVMAALDPPNLVTASLVQGRIQATTPKSTPPDLATHAADAPIWLAVKGTAALPLSGNWSNVNRLIEQTDYTVISVRFKDKAEFTAEGICRTPQAANHLDQNIRAIATLTKLPIQTRTEGATVRVTGEAPIDTVLRILH